MADIEKVKWDIERCICHVPDACRDCSHYKHGEYLDCMEELLKDALELLKEQQGKNDRLLEESASNAEMADGLKELLKEQEEQIRQLTEELEELRNKRNEVYYSGYDGSFIL